MEIRLNKLISDAGICSRREADKFIEEGRVTVNGNRPHPGQKVGKGDVVMLDDIKIDTRKYTVDAPRITQGRTQAPASRSKEKTTSASEKKNSAEPGGPKGLRPGKYVKYNKYAAARHAAREGGKTKGETSSSGIDKETMKEALQSKFGKSLGRSAIAQRLAASPKSAALRKTSRNNPINKAKRIAARNKPKEGQRE